MGLAKNDPRIDGRTVIMPQTMIRGGRPPINRGYRFKMRVRLAELRDSDDLLLWRNDEVTRKMSFDSDFVELSSHKEWFEKSLENDRRILVIGIEGNEKVGVVRFDNNFENVEVTLNLNPRFRGRGLASKFLEKSEKAIPKRWRSEKFLAKNKGGKCCQR